MVAVAEREQLLAPDLDKYAGQWVAIKDGEVLASAKSAVELVAILRERDIKDAALHRVLENPDTALIL